MKRYLIFVMIPLLSMMTLAATASLTVTAQQKTPDPLPFRITMWKLLELFGEDLDINWYSLRVYDENGNEIPYQIDDVDLNNRISANDMLIFLFKKEAKIVVSEDEDAEPPSYYPAFKVKGKEKEYIASSNDGKFSVRVDSYGFANIVKFGEVEGSIFRELGIARVSGWVGSTYYVDGKLGKHEEEVSYAFEPIDVEVLKPGPVCVTVVARLRSRRFLGLEQHVVTHILKTGDVLVDSTFEFSTYADLMKLQLMATHPLTDMDMKALHVLPLNRRLIWAEQLGITPFEYWKSRDAVKIIDGEPIIVFPATSSMKPPWWGATYIFASMEDWRANYSEKLGIFVGEVLPNHPVVYSDLKKFVYGNTWVYESREFRDGIFRWIPGEFEAYEATKGVIPNKLENWVAHYKAGDRVNFTRLYIVRKAGSLEDLVEYLKGRAHEFQSIKVVEE